MGDFQKQRQSRHRRIGGLVDFIDQLFKTCVFLLVASPFAIASA
jgi:hypothetical protein